MCIWSFVYMPADCKDHELELALVLELKYHGLLLLILNLNFLSLYPAG